MSDRKKAFWFIALLSVLVVVPFLGETIFYSKGEPREAIVALSMLESGNWILPVNYGTDIAYKPPFFYWSIAAVSSLFGEVTEFSARFPSALAFLAMQLMFFAFVAKRKNVQTAFLASILLLSSFEVHRAAVACRVDMVQVAFIVISLCLLFRWDEKGCRGVPWLAVLLMGCATLTKGPVGSIFPCACIGVYQLLRGRSFRSLVGSEMCIRDRCVSVVARTFFLESVFLVGRYRLAFFCSLFSLGIRSLQTRWTTVPRFGSGGEYRAVYGQNVLRVP